MPTTVKALYQAVTHDPSAHQRTIAAQLARQSKRRRRVVEMYRMGLSDRHAGAKLHISHGAARWQLRATMFAIYRAIHQLPRYWRRGRAAPASDQRAKAQADATERTRDAAELRDAGQRGALERAALYRQPRS
jgi:hypothetical protein